MEYPYLTGSGTNRTWALFKGNSALTIGVLLFALISMLAITAPTISPHDPAEMHFEERLSPPSASFPLGTDQFGRCIFSRIVYGAQTSLSIAIISTLIVVTAGIIIGMYAGYFSRYDAFLMRMTDILLAFPNIVLAIAIVGVVGPSPAGIILSFSISGWAKYARMIRGSTLSLKNSGFVEAARALGASDRYILFRHILPNSYGPIIEIATLGLGSRIVAISGLGFLGLGIQPPTPELGAILKDGLVYLQTAPMMALSAGGMIMLFVLATNLIGSELRSITDPRSDSIEL
ncbi:ABC transporter permease [Methanosarcina mazei]|uniref:Nickel ABC transporter permease n=2 Tax=Methanosarcina mazei TaxID=2209 RepID=A0A0F8DSG6_METMZ|nr:ABC transporter permease [Methanosarcina mazei]AKB72229.1 Oligopeptide transport system permease protein OppC [Methanosarcina mazei C16]KKF98774.1 nickel ABC transporter permease [Methanosarcina mazei]KKG13724.1 nickel ABC transporter permease [Methanosarcina mazei]KKG28559.1 nickel ABC transporter permease [Methanosarcina mazei]KKG40887.1 nickel ABC transporter permease [Methanosarcina mazei]